MSIIMAEESIVINEINYNSADSLFPKDWVELYNVTTEPINIGNWIFRDDNDEHEFLIPNNQILPPDGYIVICDSLNAFTILFPDIDNVIGDFDFKLKNDGELIRLFDDTGALIDSVHYNDVEPWPLEADGDGPTLELINPHYDNELASNWLASSGFGTPGQQNSNYIADSQDCLGVWGGESEYDECGVCNGDNFTCIDCADVPNGDNVVDMCGICDDDTSNDCTQDCNDDWDGTADYDECTVPICTGGETGLITNASCTDCAGDVNGTAELDCAGQCNGSAELDCADVCGGSTMEDCAGDCGGTAIEDCAGDCGGDVAVDECGECGGDGSECESEVSGCMNVSACNYNSEATFDNGICEENDCAGECGGSAVVNCAGECDGSATLDDCGVCNGNNYTMDCAGECGGTAIEDCAGQCNGSAELDCESKCGGLALSDMCGECDEDSSNDCIPDCSTSDADCDGNWNNFSCWGGTAISDECEICVGGSTGVTPCVLSNSNKILPLDFNIRGIYPNPFNPVTTIGYTVPILTKVKLEVYNINGIKISVLIDDYISSGYHRVNWDASDHASGIYFVMMVVDDYIATQKLMLVK